MIYVFKTSVKYQKDIRQLRSFLNNFLQQAKWNFDLKDCDKILRIDGLTENLGAVIKLLHGKGFQCEELLD